MADPIKKDADVTPEGDDIEKKEPEEGAPEKGGEEKGEKEPESKGEEDAPREDDNEEPPVRRSVKDFIIERKNKKLEKIAKSSEKPDPEPEEEEPEEEEKESNLDKTVKKHLEPIAQGVRAQADEMELRDVKVKYPEAAKLEKIIRRYMQHSAYRDVSVESIYFIVAGKYGGGGTAKIGKEKAEPQNITGGHQRRKPESDSKLPDFDTMSDKELDDLAFKVKTGHRI